MIATGYLFVIIPKGFFPQQDTGILFGTTEAGQDVSFHDMYRLQQEVGKIIQADPAVETMAMGLGVGVGNAAQNNGRMFIQLKPLEDRDANAFQVIARLRPKLAQVPGMRVYLQAAQDVTVGARASKTQFQYTLQDANFDELNAWAVKILDKLKSLPELRDVATDQQNSGTTLTLKIDRDMASRFGIQPQLIDDTLYDAFGQRQVTQYFTQVNTYYVIEEVLPQLLGDPATLDKIYIRSPTTEPDGARQRLRQMDDRSGRAAVDQPPGAVPGDHHQLQPRARAWRSARRPRRSSRRCSSCNCRRV